MPLRPIPEDERQEILKALLGDGAWEISKAEKSKRDKTLQNIAVAGNAASTVAGPAAIYSAVRNRRGGGIPRDLASAASSKMSGSKNPRMKKAGEKIKENVGRLNRPKSKGARIAAGVAGGTMVGLQAANMGTDALSTHLLRRQQKKDVSKRLKPIDFTLTATVSKALDEKKQIFGWASITEVDGQPVVDLQGDYVTIDVIEKAAHEYVTKSRKGGDMHRRNGDDPHHVSDLIESVVVTPEKKEALGMPADSPTGWWVGYQINDDETWQAFKNGERPMLSIHGSGIRKDTILPEPVGKFAPRSAPRPRAQGVRPARGLNPASASVAPRASGGGSIRAGAGSLKPRTMTPRPTGGAMTRQAPQTRRQRTL